VTVLIFFVGLMIFMGRRWTRYELGIAMGLALQASAVLITSAIYSPFVRSLLERLPVIVYDIACILWLVTFLKPETFESPPTAPISREIIEETKKWEHTLKKSLTRKKSSH